MTFQADDYVLVFGGINRVVRVEGKMVVVEHQRYGGRDRYPAGWLAHHQRGWWEGRPNGRRSETHDGYSWSHRGI